MIYPHLTIIHNHGAMVLRNAQIDDEGVARGECIGGGVTSRLFHATSTRPYPVGQQLTYQLWGRKPRPEYATSQYLWKEGGRLEVSPTPGAFSVDCCFCG